MLIDQYGRVVDYLRISVTERCNFRCLYCMPEKPFSWVPKENLLSFEEMFKFVSIAIDKGITKIRITGGEPTLRGDLDIFIKMIHDYKSDIDLALTTNGYLMPQKAKAYKEAGLKRVNMSLDSLKPDVVNKIAQKDVHSEILKGIDASLKNNLKVKLNTVPMLGVNDLELVELLEYAKSKNISLRFIKYMENQYASSDIKGMESEEVLNLISKKYSFKEVKKKNSSPAQYYELKDGYQFGIIEPHKDDFCKSCNRLRLTAEGSLIPCLYFDESLSIREHVRNGDVDAAAQVLKKILETKPEKNRWENNGDKSSTRAFYETGG